MRSSDIKAILGDGKARAQREYGASGAAVFDALVDAIDRFADSPEEFVERLSTLKPKRRRAPSNAGSIDEALVDRYAATLAKLAVDHAATSGIVERIRADRGVKKPEAIAIAKAAGVKTNSKTTKAQALQQIEGLSSARERDRQAAERIRKGA